jgi:diadenosine tetraphosphate (Ap4A) HIT family hydrolase
LGCKLSQGLEKPDVGGAVITLPGNWILNHYSGSEGFLGWLALQPGKHRTHLKDLEEDESKLLGKNIRDIEKALRAYWVEKFNKDPIERIYVACFSEYSDDHLHFHLIPRTNKLGDLLKCNCSINCWNIYKIHENSHFPQEYVIKPKQCNKNVNILMDCLIKKIKQAKRL